MRKYISLEYLKRYLLLSMGLFIMALGVALSTKAKLGTSPIASVPYVLSMALPWTMGQITFAMQSLFVLIQILILRRNFHIVQLLQLAVAVIFGYFTDLTLFIVSPVHVNNYILQWLVCLISLFLVALGIFLEVKSDTVMPSGEGLVKVIASVTNNEFGKIKIRFDCALVSFAILFSLFGLHSMKGVREGTIAAAILVGTMVKLLNRNITFIDVLLGLKNKMPAKLEEQGELI